MNPRDPEFVKKEKLGQGSFGIVHLVERRKDKALFALKEIDLRKPGMQQVMKEVETMQKLPPHRNVVRLYEHWQSADKKDMWLLLEYCSKGTLLQCLMSSARLPDAALLDLSGQLLQALLLFERHRIVHNDIKPENIFIMEGFIPKIGDLGLARFTSVGSVLSKTPGGTPLFQAPEVLSKEVDPHGRPISFPEYAACPISYQSDVYSVGVIMWSLIMRRVPDRPGAAFMLTPAIVPHAQLRTLVNCMLQPNPATRHLASLLLSTFPDVPTPAQAPAKKEEGRKGSALAPTPSPEFKADIRIGSCISIHSVLRHGVLRFHQRDSHLSVTISDIDSGAAPAQLDGRRSWERLQLRHAPNGCFALHSIEHGALLAMDAKGAVTAKKLDDLHVTAEQLDDLGGSRALPNACRWRFVEAGQGRFALHNPKANRFLRITDRGDVDGFGGPKQAHELPADWMFERFWVLRHPLPPASARDRDVGGDERQVYCNGYNYRTWHGHLPASLTFVDESCKFDAFPPGWEPSPRDADSVRVCAQHAWGVNALVLNDMFPVCTAGGPHHNPSWTPGSVLQHMQYYHDKQGDKISIDTNVVTFGAKWCVDVLLRRRVEGAVHTVPAPAATGAVSADRKQLEYKGWLYRTAHGRRVDAHIGVYNDGHVLIEVPGGWEVCPPIHDLDIRRVVVESYTWGSKFLTFDNGDEYTAGGGSRYGGIPDHIKRDGRRVAAFDSFNDVLLRKRAREIGAVAGGK